MQTSASTWRDSEGRLFTKTRRQVLHQLVPETEGAAVPLFADGQMLRLSLRRFDWCHNLARGGTIASASFQASRLERNRPPPHLNTRPAEGRPWQEVEALRRRRGQQRLHRDGDFAGGLDPSAPPASVPFEFFGHRAASTTSSSAATCFILWARALRCGTTSGLRAALFRATAL